MNSLVLTIGTVVILFVVWLLRYYRVDDTLLGIIGTVLALSIVLAPNTETWVMIIAIIALVLAIIVLVIGLRIDDSWPHYCALALGGITVVVAFLGDSAAIIGWIVAGIVLVAAIIFVRSAQSKMNTDTSTASRLHDEPTEALPVVGHSSNN